MNDLPTLIIAIFGLGLSILSIRLQYRVTPPRVALQNTINAERCILLTREKLPSELRSRFPEYSVGLPGCVVFHLIWGNAGDEVGLVDIRAITVSGAGGASASLVPEASYYNFVIVAVRRPFSQEEVLWNLPPEGVSQLALDVDYAWGFPDRKTCHFKEQKKGLHSVRLRSRIS